MSWILYFFSWRALLLGFFLGFVPTAFLIDNDILPNTTVIKFPFIFAVLYMLAWRSVPLLWYDSKLSRRFYGMSLVWSYRVWARKPIFGYKPMQVVLYALICASLGLHLLWHHELFSSSPHVSRSKVNNALRKQTEAYRIPVARLRRDMRAPPSLIHTVNVPYPRIILADVDPSSSSALNVVPTLQTTNYLLRHVVCAPGLQFPLPECTLTLRFPTFVRFSPPTLDSARPVKSAQGLNANLNGLELKVTGGAGKILITKARVSLNIMSLSSLLKIDFGTSGAVKTRMAFLSEDFAEFLNDRDELRLLISHSADEHTARREEECKTSNGFSSACSPVQDSDGLLGWTCGSGVRLEEHNCSFSQQALIAFGFSSDAVKESDALVSHSIDTVFSYPLSSVIDRSLLTMIARAQGGEVEFSADEHEMLSKLRAEITMDYATILGSAMAGERGEDRDAITQALIRQPQLYPYYRDRDYWEPILFAALETQFEMLGFP